jgi:asparagine synthase (glutamine-hydrolysing)
MCGIAGFYNTTVDAGQLQKLTQCMLHRGPDDQRNYLGEKIGLIHTRLSVIEVSPLGAQPYRFENLVLIFNGELYNYREVREELIKKGYTFQSDSDTEVLIKAFHCWREQSVHKFIGMFAFALYEEDSKQLWLFRDRLGVKPLYYSYDEKNKSLLFASELKAFTAFAFDRAINKEALFFYFRFGFVPQQHSIFKNVKKLKAGCFLKIGPGTVSEIEYWSPIQEIDYSKTETQWLDVLEETMISSFCYRMVSDVPVGVFLSGGIDSSLLSAILKKHYGPIHSFTIGFNEIGFDESVHARQVAEYLKIRHTEKKLKLSEAKVILDNFYEIYDEPFADTSGIPTSCVTQLAKESQIKVVLSADGGDELFGGYTHYQNAYSLHNRLNKIPASLRKGLSGVSEALAIKGIRENIYAFNAEHKLYALEELLRTNNPAQFFEAYIANQSIREIQNLTGYNPESHYLSSFSGKDAYQQMMLWDIKNYLTDDLLVKVDRATMHHSVESREPFLDHRLVELSQRMPGSLKIKNGEGKYIVKKLLDRYIPRSLFERKKQGFSIPIFQWFSQDLDNLFELHLSPESLSRIDCLDTSEVQREYRKYKHYKSSGKQYNIEKMWRILSFILWWNKYAAHER